MSSEQRNKIVIAGGSGFLGISLAHYLDELGYRTVILTRRSQPLPGPWKFAHWDGRTLDDWVGQLEDAAGLVNLAGRSVDCIKSPDHQDEILRSRVESTHVLGQAMRALSVPPPVWVQMSTAHIYGDPPEIVCDESSPFGYGLAPTVAKAWENEFAAAIGSQQRGVTLRTGFVIGRDRGAGQGALGKLGWIARIGLGGTVGSGNQGMSWIHEHDMNRLMLRSLVDDTMQGVYIASGPNPLPQKEFMKQLRKAVGMPLGLPATAWMVRLAAPLVFRTDPELALFGRYVVSRRLIDAGFQFHYPDLEKALAEIYRPDPKPAC